MSPTREDLDRCRAGDADALDSFLGWVTAVARRAAQNRSGSQDADDIAQETALRMWQELPNIQHGTVTGLVRTAARNLAIDRARRPSNQQKAIDTETLWRLADEARGPSEMAIAAGASEAVSEALDRIPGKYAEAVRLMYVDGKRSTELAVELGIPRGTVASRARRGLVLMAKDDRLAEAA